MTLVSGDLSTLEIIVCIPFSVSIVGNLRLVEDDSIALGRHISFEKHRECRLIIAGRLLFLLPRSHVLLCFRYRDDLLRVEQDSIAVFVRFDPDAGDVQSYSSFDLMTFPVGLRGSSS